MLLSLLFLVLSTYIIFIWGRLFSCHYNIRATESYEFFLPLIIGLCSLCFISNTITLFIGLASPWIYVCLLIPSFYRNAPKAFYTSIQKNLWPTSYLIQFLLIVSLLAILTMHAWEIRHPDTITYQNNLIEFALKGGHPVGIVSIKTQFGYGGSWFPVSALFSYNFVTGKVMTFVNLTLITVFIAYLFKKAEIGWNESNPFSLGGYILIFCLASFEYTFIRLAVTSSAPDTPAALMGLGAFMYFLNKRRQGWILTLISVTAVTMKLSLVPILALPFLHLIEQRRKSSWVKNTILGILILTPFLIKNILSTGYILYPYPGSKICKIQDAPTVKEVQAEADYIKAYARFKFASRDEKDVHQIVQMPFRRWITIWWGQLSTSEQSMMIVSFLSIFLSFYYKKKNQINNGEFWPYITTTLFGIVFWLNLAPSIRFGSAFLFAPIVFLISKMGNQAGLPMQNTTKFLRINYTVTILLIIVISIYLIYRILYFMDTSSLLIPKGPVG